MSTIKIKNENNQVRQNIAENLRRILQKRDVTQAALAKMTGDTEMIISRICRGLYTPGVGVVARIAEAMDVSMDRLAGKPPKNLSKIS